MDIVCSRLQLLHALLAQLQNVSKQMLYLFFDISAV